MRRTELRRRLLVAVDTGGVMYHPPFSYKARGTWRVDGEPATPSEVRTLWDLWLAGLIRKPTGKTMHHPRKVVLTDAGVELITRWQKEVST